jgi:hypothetical protein
LNLIYDEFFAVSRNPKVWHNKRNIGFPYFDSGFIHFYEATRFKPSGETDSINDSVYGNIREAVAIRNPKGYTLSECIGGESPAIRNRFGKALNRKTLLVDAD